MTCTKLVENKGIKAAKNLFSGVAPDTLPGSATYNYVYVFWTAGVQTGLEYRKYTIPLKWYC